MSLIGITTGLMAINNNVFPGHERVGVNMEYIEAVTKAGGVPLLLPIVGSKEAIASQVAVVDGIIFSGGEDVNPLIYGEEPIEKLGTISNERDKYELELMEIAIKLNKPILGICRGMQLINIALGGTVYQDLGITGKVLVKHQQEAKRSVPTHTVNLRAKTKLQAILGDRIIVNSFHHQAVNAPAPEMLVNATACDEVIEGIEKNGDQFIIGVQWHPEIMVSNSNMLKLFEALVEATGS